MSNDSIPDGDFTYSNLLVEPWNEQTYFLESAFSNSSSNKEESQKSSEVFSDEVLDYIKQMLLEEAIDDRDDALQSHPDLEATEKHFYELIGGKDPPSPDRPPLYSSPSSESSGNDPTRNSVFARNDFFHSNSEFDAYQNCDFYASHQPFFGFHEDRFADLFFRILPASELKKGAEEAKKFLPSGEADPALPREPIDGARRKQTRHSGESGEEEAARRSKQSAFSSDEVVPSGAVEELLLCSGDEFREIVKTTRENMYKEASLDSGVSRKSPSKKQAKEEEEADVNTLLLHCAQTVATGDKPRAYELLKQIRRHSSPSGDASQRLAHYFADGLEARLAGTGSDVYHSIVSKRKTLVDVSSAYQLYLACCPFKKIGYHFANQTILNTIQSANRVHILDFGIYFGFQWPVFLKLLSLRPGGPPKLRITGIDIPQPGFRPSEIIEESGRRLSDYAARFGVPFEYHGIAAKFDEINAEQLRIEEEEETLVVNCLFRLHSPADETALEDCPRDKVLRFIRKLNPAVFVNVVMNGTYGAPFFMTRIREALYHFSAVFDMIDATTPKQSERRMLVERDLYGRMLINAISCEGLERERPETYKQWQVRCVRAGLEMVPNRKGFVKRVKDGVRGIYHRDFHMDEDGRWLLIGWKGRIFFGLSAWKPARL